MASALVRPLLDVINTDLVDNSAYIKFEHKMSFLSFKLLHKFVRYSFLKLNINANNLS